MIKHSLTRKKIMRKVKQLNSIRYFEVCGILPHEQLYNYFTHDLNLKPKETFPTTRKQRINIQEAMTPRVSNLGKSKNNNKVTGFTRECQSPNPSRDSKNSGEKHKRERYKS